MDAVRATGPDPLALYRAQQSREMDRRAIDRGIPGFELMCRAGAAAFTQLQRRWPKARCVEVFCGGGNNGGDGYVIAALARQAGFSVQLWSLSKNLKGDAALAADMARNAGVLAEPWQGQRLEADSVIVDALLGTGFTGPLREDYAQVITAINAASLPVLAIDVPSGLSADTGMHGGEAVRATLTVSFIAWKCGLFTGVAPEYCGELLLEDLGLASALFEEFPPVACRIDLDARLRSWGPRPLAAHKGHFGHVLVMGGDYGTAGAVILASSAAARCGAGLISCATHPEHLAAILAQRPEVMVHPLGASPELATQLARASVLVIGPGLGQSDWGQSLLTQALASDKPLVMDADALNLIAAQPDRYMKHCDAQPGRVRVMTPHPGEAARLLGCSVAALQADRFQSCRELARRYRAVVLLKGAGTLIDDGQQCWVNEGGNPGMASGGMGDVLSGIIAALLAQGLSACDACCMGAAVHARSADRAAQTGERGLLAMDVVEQLRGVMNGLQP